ncbi:cellulose biosynthesis cyclic di-GMP-binding regulatory protein BcsB [Vampirovibrio sp.]|uniref:cellulose biosynthesis cyclic di-GMP-binding regulatory protein BcsB n=1 Tax=Vampirovibrio sp. TaxID=2717857 RepID=UPI0035942337
MAATEVVPLERLKIFDVILLPTVSSQYEAKFTKPPTWQVSPKSALYLEFQHSIELQPHRSWLQISVNDKVIQHIPLTKENAEGTKMTIPLPVGLLKDFNTLNFRVQQHYTDQCEDPLDKSLWTQILPATRLVFDYQPVVPKVDLGMFPYPIIDALTYSPAKVHYITGKTASEKELQALAYVNVHLAQQAQDHELKSRVTFDNTSGPDTEHLVFVGKGDSIPSAAQFAGAFGNYALQGGQWINRQTGQTLASDQGLILFFQAPGSKEHTVLVVTGNSDEAVMKAAEYLTLRPKESTLTGMAQEVPSGWNTPGTRTSKVPRFVEGQTRTFQQLGFEIQEVHKINAPPITYEVPIVGKFHQSGGKLWLDLNYSYSPQLNPEFSSLELRMNDVSIANLPLLNPAGEQMVRASVPISNELIHPRNQLVAQFHLMPDKYGWCVDNYMDNAWGKIMDDSQLRVEGSPNSYLPDAGLLNNTMYPYSKTDNLENVHLAVPANPSAELLDAMLGFTTRLGRATLADTDLRLSLSKGNITIPGDRNGAVFRTAADSMTLPDGAKLVWQTGGSALMQMLTLAEPNDGQMSSQNLELGHGAYLEQYALGADRVMSVFTASNGPGFLKLGDLLETDKQFDTLNSGFLQQASLMNPALNPVTQTRFHTEAKNNGPGNWWESTLSWLKSLSWGLIIGVLLCLFVLLVIVPILIRALFRR